MRAGLPLSKYLARGSSAPLGPWIEGFLLALATSGYATSVIRRHVRAAVVFADWLVRHRIAVADIDERVIAQFVGARARWRSPSRRNGRLSAVASGVRALAAHLWLNTLRPYRQHGQGKGQKDRYVMLSPKLLELLRTWWRMARPTLWLFPGDRPGHAISKDAVEQACQKVPSVRGRPLSRDAVRSAPALHVS